MSPKRLSSVIKKLREARGLTQEQVAKQAQVTKNYITMLESGARKSPSLSVLKRLARALGVPVTELLA
jgi:transcriptional regulator with XRE-family HTH domain